MSTVDDPPSNRTTAVEVIASGVPAPVGPVPPATPDRLTHQPALDGLRALAVLAVIVFHNGSDNPTTRWLPDGALGVDIFFVLSGFLITSLLLIDHAHRGSTVSRRFWVRRLRRLLPAVFVLLAITAFYALLFAPPWQLSSIREGGFATLFYAQNWYILSGRSTFTPLSHTWSLSVEEQWYLVWPLLLAAILYFSRGRRSRVLVAILGLVVVSAVCMAVLFDPKHWARAYNGTDTRGFELLMGAGLGVLLLGRPLELRGAARVGLELAGLAGIVFLGWTMLTSKPGEAWMFRGGFVLVAVVAAIVIAASVSPSSRIIRPALSWAPLTAIGLISYGLYLFHVPVIFIVTPERVGFSGVSLLVLRLVVVFAIATLSYFLVEMPVRRGWLTGRRLIVIAPACVVIVLAFLVISTAGSPTSSAAGELTGTRVLVAGEASAFDLGQGGLFSQQDISGATVAAFCGILPGRPVIGGVPQAEPCRGQWAESYRDATQAFDPQVSVLMVGAEEIFDREIDGTVMTAGSPELTARLRAGLARARRSLTADGQQLVVLAMPCITPAPGTAPARAAIQRDALRRAWVNSELQRFARANDARFADLGPVLCPGGTAPAPADGSPAGGAQLTPAQALAVWHWLAPIAKDAEPSR
jgi:peptidoglycan/LPS O-acetylase OafA/YrhL